MAERIFKGTGDDPITYEEADEMADKALTQLMYYIYGLIKETTEDGEERANASVEMGAKLALYGSACVLKGILIDPDVYLKDLGLPEGVRASIEEVGA